MPRCIFVRGDNMCCQSAIPKFLILLSILARCENASSFITEDRLYFRNQNLTSVPSELITDANTENITKAIFSHNNINTLKTSDFTHLSIFKNLKYIFFDHNNITYIQGNTFKQVPNIKFLELSHNGLNEISNDLYDDLNKLKSLHYINLKRNPIKNFVNIDKLSAKGVQIEYDGVLGREKRLKMRSRRVTSDEGTVNNKIDDIYVNDESSMSKGEEIKGNISEAGDHHEEINADGKEDERNSTMVHDKPVKAYVVDHKMDQTNTGNTKDNNKFLGSIIFNFLAAFLVLVALPIAMVVYYFTHRNDSIS